MIPNSYSICANWAISITDTGLICLEFNHQKQTRNTNFHFQDGINSDASLLPSLKPPSRRQHLQNSFIFEAGRRIVPELTCWECSKPLASKRRSEARPRVQLCFSSFSTSRPCLKDATAPFACNCCCWSPLLLFVLSSKQLVCNQMQQQRSDIVETKLQTRCTDD